MARLASAVQTNFYFHKRLVECNKQIASTSNPSLLSMLLLFWVTTDTHLLRVRISNSIDTSLPANWRFRFMGSCNFDSGPAVCAASRIQASFVARNNSPRGNSLAGRQCSSWPSLPSGSAICHIDYVQVRYPTYPSHSHFLGIQSHVVGVVGVTVELNVCVPALYLHRTFFRVFRVIYSLSLHTSVTTRFVSTSAGLLHIEFVPTSCRLLLQRVGSLSYCQCCPGVWKLEWVFFP